jgi:hypothetical protein
MSDQFVLKAPPKRKKGRRRAIVFVALSTALALSGIALASWLTSGNGVGRSHAGAMQGLTITPTAVSVGGDLFPGANGELAFQVGNPNSGAVTVTTATSPGGFIYESTSASADSCLLTVNAAQLQAATVGAVIPATGSMTFHIPDAIHMGNGADTSCQNGTFTVPLTVTASS